VIDTSTAEAAATLLNNAVNLVSSAEENLNIKITVQKKS